MRLLLLLLAGLSLFIVQSPIQAQDDDCDIDLVSTITALIEAQRAADQGDDFAAVQQLEQVQAQLDALIASCEGVTVPLGRTFTSPDGLFSFSYPDGWAFASPLRGQYAVGSTQEALNIAMDSGFPDVPDGEAVIGVVQGDFDDLGLNATSFDEIVDEILEDGLGDGIELSNAVSSEINGYETIAFDLRGSGLQGKLVVYNFATEDNQLAVVFGLAQGDDFAGFAPVLDAVVKSVQYGDRVEISGVPLDDLQYVDAIPLTDYDLDVLPRLAVIAPDGETVAVMGRDTICLLALATEQVECHPIPQSFDSTPLLMLWSPDSRFIAFTQNFFLFFDEPDLWVFDTDNRVFTNLTEDNTSGGIMGPSDEDEGPALLDHTFTWGPDGSLYFIRQRADSADDSPMDGFTELYRVDPLDGEPELIRDLTGDIPPLSVYHTQEYNLKASMAVSLDGEQIALAVLAADYEDRANGVWVLDASGEDAPEQVVRMNDLTIGLPGYMQDEERVRLAITGVDWSADGEALYLVGTTPASFPRLVNVYQVELETGVLTALVDYSDIESQEDLLTVEDEEGRILSYRIPTAVVMAPDYSTPLAMTTLPPDEIVGLAVIGADGERRLLYEEGDFQPVPNSISTIAEDGTALMWGYLFLPADAGDN